MKVLEKKKKNFTKKILQPIIYIMYVPCITHI